MKIKSLFDHINHITSKQTKDYWDTLNDKEKKNWSNYMVHRFLSMKSEWIEIVNEFQKYNLRPQDLYKLYINILPKGKQWLKYIKRRKIVNYPMWVIKIVSEYYKVSLVESQQYVDLYYMSEQGRAELKEILMKYGTDPKEINKLGI